MSYDPDAPRFTFDYANAWRDVSDAARTTGNQNDLVSKFEVHRTPLSCFGVVILPMGSVIPTLEILHYVTVNEGNPIVSGISLFGTLGNHARSR